MAVIPTHYKITGRQRLVSQGGSGTIPVGTVLVDRNTTYTDVYPHYGFYFGIDTTLAFGRYLAAASIDYLWATNREYTLYNTQTSFNPSGLSVGINGGIQF